ncbi:MAG: hypothetical protein COC24_011015 [Alphaproteobacteria bacterium]|nr:hypothetical protein [Alphaproteobacteria bacterium]
MSEAESLYLDICTQIPTAEKSQMFGKPCYKIDKKAFVAFFQNEIVFKLAGDIHSQALALDGAQLFDPAGNGRAMKQWVQVPFAHKATWAEFAQQAC